MMLLRPCRPASLTLLYRGSWSSRHTAVPHRRAYNNTNEDEREKEGENRELDYDPTAFVPKRPRSATQIQALVQNVELVREQLKSPLLSNLADNQASSQVLMTVPKQTANLFIPLVLPETPLSAEAPRRQTRYMSLMDIVKVAESGKRPVRRILQEFAKGDLSPHEIQMIASAVPTREVLDTAFEYCVKSKLFRPACGIVALAFTSVEMTPPQIRTQFIRLMQQFPLAHDAAHILATLQAAKKAKIQLNGSMYSALISRLALSPDCNPETIFNLIKEAEEAKQTLSIHAYNNLLRYFATTQNLAQCQQIAETARKRHPTSENISTTMCLLTQAACIVHEPDLAWQYYLDLKKRLPNCLSSFKHLYKHILAVLLTDAEKHLDRITTLFSDLSTVSFNINDLRSLLQKRPGFPFYCISILNYSRLHKIKPHPQFASFVASEMYSQKHIDIIRYYLEFQHHPNLSVKDMLGTFLYFIPAKSEDTQMLENQLSGLHPVASADATSPLWYQHTRDSNVFAIAIDLYSKLARHDAVTHTLEFMTNEGATPNFLVHALLFRLYFYTGAAEQRDYHLAQMKQHLKDHTFGSDLAWLCTPLLSHYCEVVKQADAAGTAKTPELEDLRNLIPQAVAHLGVDERSWSCAAAATTLASVRPQLAIDLISAMKQYDATQVDAEVFQPVIDAVCVDATQAEGGAEDAKKGKKRPKKDEMDIFKHMKEMDVTPTATQAQQLMRWYQDSHRLAQAAQVLQDLIASAPKTQQLPSMIMEFLVRCSENKEGLHVMSVVKHMEGKVELKQAEYTQLIRSLLTHKLPVVALDVLRWMSTQARTAFAPVREELLRDAPDAPWVRTLQKMS